MTAELIFQGPHKTLPCASQVCSISVLFYPSSTRQDAFCESHYRKLSSDLCNCGFSNLGLKVTSHCLQQCCCSDVLGYNWRTECSQMYSRLLATSSTTRKYSSPGIENCECFEKAFWRSWNLAAHLGNVIKVLDLPFKEDGSTFWWYPSLAMICVLRLTHCETHWLLSAVWYCCNSIWPDWNHHWTNNSWPSNMLLWDLMAQVPWRELVFVHQSLQKYPLC
jgi:hypothetical protein